MSAIQLSDIRIDGGTQSRASIDQQAVADYAEAMAAGDTFPPVVAFFDGAAYWLADGFHRYQAYARAKVVNIPADVRQGTQRDAILFSVSANSSHGLRRTNDDKRRAVLTLLNDPEWAKWSDREIARRCAVDGKTVAGLRPKLSAELPQIERTVSRKGATFQQNIANIGAQPKASPKQEAQAERITSHAEPVVEQTHEPLPADPVEAKLRRTFRALTKDAQEDAYVGLSLDLQDCKVVTAKLKAERDALKAQVKELSSTDSGAVIRRLQQDVVNANNKRWKEGEKTADALKQVHAVKKNLKALEREEIPL